MAPGRDFQSWGCLSPQPWRHLVKPLLRNQEIRVEAGFSF